MSVTDEAFENIVSSIRIIARRFQKYTARGTFQVNHATRSAIPCRL
jgi:hypothetical protein